MPDLTASAATATATAGPLLGWALRASAEAAVIAGLVLVAQTALGRWLTPAWRHRLWGLVVLRLLLPVSPASPASLWNGAAAIARAAAVERWAGGPVPAVQATRDGSPAAGAASSSAATAVASPGTPESGLGGTRVAGQPAVRVRYGPIPGGSAAGATAASDPMAAGPAEAGPPAVHPPASATDGGGGARTYPSVTTAAADPWLAAVRRVRAAVGNVPAPVATASAAAWLLVTAALLARLVAAQLAFARRLRGATPVTDPAVLADLADAAGRLKLRRVPAVWETAAVRGPAAAGVWRPRVLVPPGLLAALTPAEQQAVLLHELAHVRHRDVAANWLLAVLAAAHWFNPVLWLAFARLRADRELARDATVLGLTTGRGGLNAGRLDPAAVVDAYAQLLLKLAERVGPARFGGGTRRAVPLIPACPVTVGMVDDGAQDDGVAPAEGGPAGVAPGSARLVGSQRSRPRVADGVPHPADGRPRLGSGRPHLGGRGRLAPPEDQPPLAPGLLGRRAGLHRRLRMITRLPATAAGRFAPAGPILFAALAVATLTGPRVAAEPAAASRPPQAAPAGNATPTTRPATGPAAGPAKPVGQLTAEARRLVAAGYYRAALDAVDQILARDPTNEYAVGVRPLIEDRRALQEKRAAQERAAATGERRVPYDDILTGPADWPDLRAVKPGSRPAAEEEGLDLLDRLDRKVPEVNLDKVSLEDAIQFIRDVGQFEAVVVNWPALAAAGVRKTAPVSLRLYNVKACDALGGILDRASTPTVKLGYVVTAGLVTVSTADDLEMPQPATRDQPASRPAGAGADVRKRVARTRQLVAEGRTAAARAEVDQILTLDPKNEYALGVRPMLDEGNSRAEQRRPSGPPVPPAPWPVDPPPGRIEGQIDGLTLVARRLVEDGRFQDALAVVDKILFRDPKNEYASGIRQLLEDKVAVRRGLGRNGFDPDAPADAGRAVEEERQRIAAGRRPVQALLDRTLPAVDLRDVPFRDAIDQIRDLGGVNIFVNWRALQVAGVKTDTPVNMRLYKIKVSKALQLVLDAASTPAAKLGFTIDEGVVSVSTGEDLSKNVLTRVYDVRDLLVVIPDYDPTADRGSATGRGPAAATTRPATQPAPRPQTRPTTEPAASPAVAERAAQVGQIVRLIQETVAPDSWRDTGGTVGAMKELSGQLIITQTPENHVTIDALLRQLREARGTQVMVEARFIQCDDRFLADQLAALNVPATRAAMEPASQSAVGAASAGPASRPADGVFLTKDQVDRLLLAAQRADDVSIVAAPRLTLFNGQRAYVMVNTQRAYTRDYATVVAANGETRYEPVVDAVEAGVTMDVRATASADRRYATLTLRPKLSFLLGMTEVPWVGRPAGSNLTVQEPRLRTSGLNTTLSVPDGGTVLLGGMEDPGPFHTTDEFQQMLSRDPQYVAMKQQVDQMDIMIGQQAIKFGANNQQVVAAKELREQYQQKVNQTRDKLKIKFTEASRNPTTGPATQPAADTRPAAPAADRSGRRLFLLVTPKLIVQREVEQRQFPLLRTRE